MKQYETPCVTVLELQADETLAAAIKSEPIVEDNDDDLTA